MLQRMDEVFTALGKARLKLKPQKCILFARQSDYLGYIISERGVSVSPSKISIIRAWPISENATGVRSFLGTASYYRRFVRDFASIAAPLHRLTEKGAVCLDAETTKCFQIIKNCVINYTSFAFSSVRCALCARHRCKSYKHRGCFEPGDRRRGICAWLC